jgi:hypothetical protein
MSYNENLSSTKRLIERIADYLFHHGGVRYESEFDVAVNIIDISIKNPVNRAVDEVSQYE